jgi:enolase-phosphatase E1
VHGKREREEERPKLIFCVLEIFAATKAGYQVVISDRPGNAPLGPESKEFKIVTSFDQI